MAFLSALGSIASNILPGVAGAWLGYTFDKKRDQKNRDFQQNLTNSQNQFNYDMQKEFAQNGLSWRVNDALKAGISPLAALGMNPVSASPVMASGDSGYGSNYTDTFSRIGSRIGDSLSKLVSEDTKLTVEGKKLDNDRKRLQNEQLIKDLSGVGVAGATEVSATSKVKEHLKHVAQLDKQTPSSSKPAPSLTSKVDSFVKEFEPGLKAVATGYAGNGRYEDLAYHIVPDDQYLQEAVSESPLMKGLYYAGLYTNTIDYMVDELNKRKVAPSGYEWYKGKDPSFSFFDIVGLPALRLRKVTRKINVDSSFDWAKKRIKEVFK